MEEKKKKRAGQGAGGVTQVKERGNIFHQEQILI